MDASTSLPALPFPLRWDPPPVRFEVADTGSLQVRSGARTDLFVDPGGEGVFLNAPRLVGMPPAGDFQLSARVSVDFASTFDAGVLLVWADDARWAKLCFEFSPAGEPTVVSVVTRRTSDDANAFTLTGSTVWLRISRLSRAYAFHASTDGRSWTFVRHFEIGSDSARIGFESQSPKGTGCTAVFDEIRFATARLGDLRDGS
ncbi:MAG: DUF1349 domain-containing protein [Micromonosporaceae bacterium]|nr:DUF1349 domain-containing protein [Micromonosporaceae bacterium]